MASRYTRNKRFERRGSALPLVAVMCPVLFAFAALSVDIGQLYNAKAQLQRCADAGALAGAATLIDERRLQQNGGTTLEIEAAVRSTTRDYVTRNHVLGEGPTVDLNVSNSTDGDIVLGTLADLSNYHEPLSTANPNTYNSVYVRVRRDTERNGPIGLFFARIMGIYSADVGAEATATIDDDVVGYRVTPTSGNAELMPFALHVNAWNALMAGASPIGDQYEYDPDTGGVDSGTDGVVEINFYPGGGATQLPPGNFGTVDIGSSNNSTNDIRRQILEGVSAEDLAYHGGELKLGPEGTLTLGGDPGLSAGFKDALEAIIGQPRAVPLFSEVSGNGNNAVYTIVGFAGIRIMDVKLTGSMDSKYVIVQSAYVVDDAVITQPGASSSYLVYRAPILTR
ncbi:MAG TPA: pilus assembly protein TadG-related protein [Phycisphaerae bacterium]|nr:pilus assembly protein TadG-related protein [Phycisphaerae bacterium]